MKSVSYYNGVNSQNCIRYKLIVDYFLYLVKNNSNKKCINDQT